MQFLDAYSITFIIGAFAVITLACYEAGFRIGRCAEDIADGRHFAAIPSVRALS